MNPRGLLISIAFLFFIGPFVHAQGITISGTVHDSHTQEPISFASIYLAKSHIGLGSDSSGFFSLALDSATVDTLVVSYVGYQLYKLPISLLNDALPLDIQLERGIDNAGVVVKANVNKGLFLWRKIMSRKQEYNRYNFSNFGYEAYNKLEIDIKNFNAEKAKKNILLKPFSFILKPLADVAENDGFLPAYLIESISNYSYQRDPKKYLENIKASNTRGFIDESMSKLLGVMRQNVNIYNNTVNVMDKNFISPFHDNADNFYSFSVPDTQMVSGNKIFHFVFKSKRPGQNVFEGDAWVLSGSFQIQKMTLYLGQDANINYIDRISIFQEFLPINDSTIFLSRDRFFADFRVLGKKSLTLTGRKSTSYSHIVVNNDSLTSIFAKQSIAELVTNDSGFTQIPDSSWEKLRHDSLSRREKAIYTTIDKLLYDPKYKRLYDDFKFLGSGYKNVGLLEVGKWYSLVSGNQWEGLRFKTDVGTNKKFSKNLHLHTYLAYGTRDQKFKGQAEAWYILKRKPYWSTLHLSYQDDVDNAISHAGELATDNVLALAFRKPNSTRKFLRVRGLQFEATKDWGRGFSSAIYVSKEEFTPLQNLPFKDNFPANIGRPLTNFEVALKLRFAYLEQYIIGDFFRYPVSSQSPVIELLVAKGISNIINSAYDYTKIAVTVSDVVRLGAIGKLRYKLSAGKINGTLPFTFLENHTGNDLYYYNADAFNLMRRFEYLSDQYASINMEHNVGSGLFRFIPITRKLKWRQFWNLKILGGSLSNKNKALNNSSSFFRTLNGDTYMELGTGIDNIFKIFRLDFVWNLQPRPLPDRGDARWGVFGSLKFQF